MPAYNDPRLERYIQKQMGQLPPTWLADPRMDDAMHQFLRGLYPRPLNKSKLREFLREYMWTNLPPNYSEDEVNSIVDGYIKMYKEHHRRETPPCLYYAGALMFMFGSLVLVMIALVIVVLVEQSFWKTDAGQTIIYAAGLVGLVAGILLWIRHQVRSIFRLVRLALLLALALGLAWLLIDSGIIDLSALLDSAPDITGFE